MKKVWLAPLLAALAVASGLGARKVLQRSSAVSASAVPSAEAGAQGQRKLQALEVAENLYQGKLSPGWQDWGWGPHDLGHGPAKVAFAGYSGLLLHHAQLPWDFGGLAFRFKAPPEFGSFLQVSLRRAGAPDDQFPVVDVTARHLAPVEDGFVEALIDWKELNPKQEVFDRVMFGTSLMVGSEQVLLDGIVLTKSSGDKAPGEATAEDLKVLCAAGSYPISEQIYGGSAEDWKTGQSIRRYGGNPLSRLNWDLGAWNVGKDWYFENGGPDHSFFDTVERWAKEQHQLAMVVPMIGWVAKDRTSVGFPRARFGAQEQFDPYRAEAGNGVGPDSKPLPPGEPELTSVPASPELIRKWIAKLVEQDKARGRRGVHMYILDNEPSLWSSTHRDVHPKALDYDELLQRTIAYAEAIRASDPDAVIAGPAEWGWLGYFYSALDSEKGVDKAPDRKAHGDQPLVAWYLKKLAEYEKAHGKRLLDVLDLHFYPAADGLYGREAHTDLAASELRLRSTRALWDPSYYDESWIKEPIGLIPRMQQWVRENYPGRKLSIGEWSFGAEQHISGGLAAAEALGRFGQQRLDAAFHWGDLNEGTPGFWAFRAFRNFDGKGARFLDIGVPVKEGAKVSLFASRDVTTSKLVLVLINRNLKKTVSASLSLEGCVQPASAVRAFNYTEKLKSLTEGKAEVVKGGITTSLPPFSINVLEVSTLQALPPP